MLEGVGFAMERSAEDAWPDFRGWRVNYETIAYRLADRLTAPPAPWSGSRRHLRSGTVEPRRPPQRRPRSDSLAKTRPQVVNSPRRPITRPAGAGHQRERPENRDPSPGSPSGA
jgi:hypothetical protein